MKVTSQQSLGTNLTDIEDSEGWQSIGQGAGSSTQQPFSVIG